MSETTTEEKLKQIQLMEQNMQVLLQQKQQFQSQLLEVDSAMKELENTTESYKIIGNVMVNTSSEKLVKEMQHKKEILTLRIETMEKQEKSFKEKFKTLQTEVMGSLENGE